MLRARCRVDGSSGHYRSADPSGESANQAFRQRDSQYAKCVSRKLQSHCGSRWIDSSDTVLGEFEYTAGGRGDRCDKKIDDVRVVASGV